MESIPVYRASGFYAFTGSAAQIVGVVTQIGAEDLWEAHYFALAAFGDTCLGIAGPTGERGDLDYHPGHENALQLFWAHRAGNRAETDYCPRELNHEPAPRRDGPRKIRKLAGKLSYPRYRFCGGKIRCACWYEKVHQTTRVTRVTADGEWFEENTELRHQLRWNEHFVQQCQICGEWDEVIEHYERESEHLCAHPGCLEAAQTPPEQRICICGKRGITGRPRKNDGRAIWRCSEHQESWPGYAKFSGK